MNTGRCTNEHIAITIAASAGDCVRAHNTNQRLLETAETHTSVSPPHERLGDCFRAHNTNPVDIIDRTDAHIAIAIEETDEGDGGRAKKKTPNQWSLELFATHRYDRRRNKL